MNKFFGKAKWGNARVGKTTLEYHPLAEDGRPAGRLVHETVHSLDITPEMKAKALGEGFPMFRMEGAEARAAAATSRPWKGKQKVYQAARSIIRPGDEVLDYGSGKYLEARSIVEEAGGRYFAHDPYQGIHGDMSRKYDVVMGSNVLNVQSKARNAEGEYYEALDEMTGLVDRDGVLVVNMPLSGPRADWMTPSRLKADLQERFGSVKQQGEVFIATNRGGAARFRVEDGDAFAAAIDDFVAGKLGDAPIVVGKTPEVLQRLGAKDLPVVIDKSTLRKVLLDKHGIPVDAIKQLPEQLIDPVMVFDSATVENSLVIMTELQHEGKTIIAAIHLSRQSGRHVVNDIASIYGKDDDSWFKRQIDNGLLRYVNKEKSRRWFMTRGLQLPKVRGTSRDSSYTILFDTDIVKPTEDEGGKPHFRLADDVGPDTGGRYGEKPDLRPRATDTTVDPSSLFEEVEARRRAAKGIKVKSFKERMTESATKIWHSWSRHFTQLDPNTQGHLINVLRLFEEIPNSSKAQAADIIADIVGDMNKAVLDEDAYYHHQVLEVLAAKDRIGTGTSSGDVRLHTKGWQRGHEGHLAGLLGKYDKCISIKLI